MKYSIQIATIKFLMLKMKLGWMIRSGLAKSSTIWSVSSRVEIYPLLYTVLGGCLVGKELYRLNASPSIQFSLNLLVYFKLTYAIIV